MGFLLSLGVVPGLACEGFLRGVSKVRQSPMMNQTTARRMLRASVQKVLNLFSQPVQVLAMPVIVASLNALRHPLAQGVLLTPG